ncbi:MAG: hypothetical protein ACREGA_00455 [Candidatus Saccharimonadales bacterium]
MPKPSSETVNFETHPWLEREAAGDSSLLGMLIVREAYFDELAESGGQTHANPYITEEFAGQIAAIETRKQELNINSLEQP